MTSASSPSSSGSAALLALGDEKFVSLTTFRKSGKRVSTPIWVARDGEDLVMFTPHDSGKVKRLRNSDRVELRPCSRMGAVAEDAPTVEARCVVEEPAAAVDHATALLRRKYGFQFLMVVAIERVVRKAGQSRRVALRVTAA